MTVTVTVTGHSCGLPVPYGPPGAFPNAIVAPDSVTSR